MIYLISNSKNSRVKNLNVSKIEYLKFKIDLKNFDNLIITSKNVIFSMLRNHIFIDEVILQSLTIFAIGQKSAQFFMQLGFKQVYISKRSNAKEFADEILPYLKNRKNLYLKAKISAFDMKSFFKKKQIDCKIMEVYKTSLLKLNLSMKPKENSILIFTSPSSVKNFIKNFYWIESYKAICIGNTTADALKKYTNPIVCEKQDINSCINLAFLKL